MKKLPLMVAFLVVSSTLLIDFSMPVTGEYIPQGQKAASQIPKVMGNWFTVEEIPPDPETVRILGTDDILYRIYRRIGDPVDVDLSLVFSAGHRHSMHPPEVCYQSQGMKLVGRGEVNLEPDCTATKLRLAGDGQEILVNYWFFSEGRETSSYMLHQIHLVLNQILYNSQPSVLLRISTPILKGDTESAQQRLNEFGEIAIPILRQYLPTYHKTI